MREAGLFQVLRSWGESARSQYLPADSHSQLRARDANISVISGIGAMILSAGIATFFFVTEPPSVWSPIPPRFIMYGFFILEAVSILAAVAAIAFGASGRNPANTFNRSLAITGYLLGLLSLIVTSATVYRLVEENVVVTPILYGGPF